MRRLLGLCLLFALPMSATELPREITRARPVSEPVFTRAQDGQQFQKVASNGSLALVAWNDSRDGVSRVWATRVDAAGTPLDPFSIPIIAGGLSAVVWNGSEFVVVCQTDIQNSGVANTQFVFVTVDGTISHRVATGRSLMFGASTAAQNGARMLFFEWPPPQPYVKLTAVIVDGSGTVVTPSFTVVATSTLFSPVVASRESEFLVLGRVSPGSGVSAIRINDKGEILGVADSKIPIDFTFSEDQVVGGRDGYLYGNGISVYQLDANGIFTGVVTKLVTDIGLRPAALAADGDRYIVAATGRNTVFVAEVQKDNSAVALKKIADWPGYGVYQVGFAWTGGQHVLLTSAWGSMSSGPDLFEQRITATLDADDPHAIAFTATQQGNAHVAFSAHGYAVTFSENGPDEFLHHFVRRFSLTGTPLDDAPMEIARKPSSTSLPLYPYFGDTRIVSSGETYLIAWGANDAWHLRRMSALTGGWIDEESLPVVFTYLALASNGADVLATYRDPRDASLHGRRIRMTGAPLADPEFLIATPGIEQAVSTNGTDYLVVWIDGAGRYTGGLPPPLPLPSYRVFARRIAADGEPIDATPLAVSENAGANPAIGGAASGYIILWQGRVARVTNEGAVEPEVPMAQQGSAQIIPFGHDFVVLFANGGSNDVPQVTWSAMRFDATTSLSEIAARTATPIVIHESWRFGAVSAAADAQRLVLAYDDVSDASFGRIPRVIMREFANPVARRRAIAP